MSNFKDFIEEEFDWDKIKIDTTLLIWIGGEENSPIQITIGAFSPNRSCVLSNEGKWYICKLYYILDILK